MDNGVCGICGRPKATAASPLLGYCWASTGIFKPQNTATCYLLAYEHLTEELRVERQWSAEKGEARDALRAKNASLRKALGDIALGHAGYVCCMSAKDCGTAMADFARAALAPPPAPAPAAGREGEPATPEKP